MNRLTVSAQFCEEISIDCYGQPTAIKVNYTENGGLRRDVVISVTSFTVWGEVDRIEGYRIDNRERVVFLRFQKPSQNGVVGELTMYT